LGYAAGAILGAIGAAVIRVGHQAGPIWPQLSGAADYFPVLSGVTGIGGFLMQAAGLCVYFVWINQRFQTSWLRMSLFMLTGLALSSLRVEESPLLWLTAGIVSGAVLMTLSEFLRRTSPMLVIPAIAALTVLLKARGLVTPGYPDTLPESITAVILILAVSWVWMGILRPSPQATPVS
jgi:hypothetical protein